MRGWLFLSKKRALLRKDPGTNGARNYVENNQVNKIKLPFHSNHPKNRLHAGSDKLFS